MKITVTIQDAMARHAETVSVPDWVPREDSLLDYPTLLDEDVYERVTDEKRLELENAVARVIGLQGCLQNLTYTIVGHRNGKPTWRQGEIKLDFMPGLCRRGEGA